VTRGTWIQDGDSLSPQNFLEGAGEAHDAAAEHHKIVVFD